MARQNQLYYIAPSAISITPNANGLQTDLAVYVAKGTKIKVYNPYIEDLDTQDANFVEWTFAGRNRRLTESYVTIGNEQVRVPFTIYARLSKTDRSDGYLVFAHKVLNDSNEWEDPYVLSPNTSSSQKLRTTDRRGYTHRWDPIPADQTQNGRSGYWWIKLGDVLDSKDEFDQVVGRYVSLDTGILGTDQFNAEWLLNPDGLPRRIEFSCKVDDNDMGQIPYVRWDKKAVLSAKLIEGWDTDVKSLVRRWTISRNTGNEAADYGWNYPYGDSSTSFGDDSSSSLIPSPGDERRMQGGKITLSHKRGDNDDFGGAPAVVYTVTAWGEKEDSDSSDSTIQDSVILPGDGVNPETVIVPIATGVITMLAETTEAYEIEPSVSIVSYRPSTGRYTPDEGVVIHIRAKAQDGSVKWLDNKQIGDAKLRLFYMSVGSDSSDSESSDSFVPDAYYSDSSDSSSSSSGTTYELKFYGGQAVLPVSAFAEHKSIVLWLTNMAGVQVDRITVAFVQYGENGIDGEGSEHVFIRSRTDTPPVIATKPADYRDSRGHTYLSDDFLPVVYARDDIEKDNSDPGSSDSDSSVSDSSVSGDGTAARPYECTDDPKGVSDIWKYEWCAKRTMGDPDKKTGRRKWNMYDTKEMSLYNYMAGNAVRLDTDNEMDTVPTNSMGVLQVTTTVETVVRLFDGPRDVAIDGDKLEVSAISYNGGTAACTKTQQGNNVKLSWTLQAGWQISAVNKAHISYKYKEVTYHKDFIVAASLGQPILQLKPSYSALPCVRNASTNALGNPPALSLKVVKVDGSGSTESDATAANLELLGVTIRYSTNDMPATPTAYLDWTALDPANSLQVANTELNVYIAMFSSAGVLLDRETIPILKDGAHGDGITSITREYAISAQSTTANESTAPVIDGTWSASSPAVTDSYPYLWVKETVTYKYKTTPDVRYYYIGKKGDNGVDAKDAEWVYIRTTQMVPPVVVSATGDEYKADDYLPVATVSSGRIKGYNGTEADANVAVQCTDDPQGVNDTWKYEWEIKRTKGNADAYGNREWNDYSGPMTLHNNLAESALIIDIDNDNDQFGVDADGVVLVQQTRSTVVTMLYGTEEQAFSANYPTASLMYDDGISSVPSGVATASVTPVQNTDNKEYTISVTIYATGENTPVFGTNGHNGMYVDITGSCEKGGPKTIRFTLEKVMSGQKGESPTLYQLALSQKSFSYGRDASNNLTAKSNSVTVNVKKTYLDSSGNYVSDIITLKDSGKTCKYKKENDTTTTDVNINNPTVTINPIDVGTNRKVYFELSTGDTEEVPIIVDGENGKNSVRLALTNEHEDFLYSDTGLVAPKYTSGGVEYNGATSHVRLYDGGTEKTYGTDFSATVDYNASTGVSNNSSADNYAFVSNDGVLTVRGISTDTAKVVVTSEYPAGSGVSYSCEFTANRTASDKYDLVLTPNAVSFNKSEVFPTGGISIGVKYSHMDAQGGRSDNNTPASSIGEGNVCLYYAFVNPNGSLADTMTFHGSSTFVLDSTNANAYIGIYFELRKLTSSDGSTYRLCDYETVEIAKTENGKSITSANVLYALTDSGTQIPEDSVFKNSQTGYDDFPPLNENKYIWEATKVTYSTGATEFTGKMCLGKTSDFLSGVEVYAVSQSDSVVPSSWDTTYTKTKGNYLWTATRVQYADKSTFDYLNPKCVGYWGEDGGGGPGYKTIVYRDNVFNEAQWSTFGTIGHLESWDNTSDSRNGCGVGDWFLVVGTATDTGYYHTLTYECDNDSENLSGKCINHQITKNGANSIRLALDNEHEDFLYDGTTLVAPKFTLGNVDYVGAKSEIHLYDGGTEDVGTYTVDLTQSSGYDVNNPPIIIISSVIHYYLYVPAITAESAEVVVKATYNDGEYYAKFTANRNNQDKYDIVVSPSSIAYNSATYQTQTINVSATGIGLGGTSIDSAISDGNTGHLRLFWAYVDTGGVLTEKSRKKGTSFTMTASECAAHVGLYIELRYYYDANDDDSSVNYRLCDYETVEIAKSENGADSTVPGPQGDAYTLKVTPSQLVYNPNTARWVGASGFSVQRLNNGEASTEGYITVYHVNQSGQRRTKIDPENDVYSPLETDSRCDVVWTYDTKVVAEVSVPIVKYGTNGSGEPGHAGRWYYYAGEWDQTKAQQGDYKIENTQAPYVKHGTQTGADNVARPMFWMLDNKGEEPSILPQSYTAEPETGATNPWTQMASEQQYYIAKAFFGDYANLGSFIINGDWMISQTPINGSPSSNFTDFDITHPNSKNDDQDNFIPMYAVDGKTGKVYMNDAYVAGEINATSGSFAGSLNAATGTFEGALSGVTGTFSGSISANDNKIVITSTPIDDYGDENVNWRGFAVTNNGKQGGDLATIGARIDDNGYDYGRIALVKRVKNTWGTDGQVAGGIFLSAGDGSIMSSGPLIVPGICKVVPNGGGIDLPQNPKDGQILLIKGLGNGAYIHTYHQIFNGDNEGPAAAADTNFVIGGCTCLFFYGRMRNTSTGVEFGVWYMIYSA
jgi:hypothetical protein